MEKSQKQAAATSGKEDLDGGSELKPHAIPEMSREYSPERSSISSDHTSLTHGSSPREEPAAPSSPSPKPPADLAPKIQAPSTAINRFVADGPTSLKKKADPGDQVVSVGEGDRVGGSGRGYRPSLSILRRAKREKVLKKVALGLRVFGLLFCLVSLSVMAADRSQGWALDSFDRYKEFRYCMSVNMIGFVYSGAQALDLGYQLFAGSSILVHHFRYLFDFAVDQMIAYLLISASSSAATRVEDWVSNWGTDKFPQMAGAAVSISFLGFAALASSSLISGYAICTSAHLT